MVQISISQETLSANFAVKNRPIFASKMSKSLRISLYNYDAWKRIQNVCGKRGQPGKSKDLLLANLYVINVKVKPLMSPTVTHCKLTSLG